MKPTTTIAIPLLCCAMTFGIIGMSMSDVTFLSLGAGFLAAGLPLLLMGARRQES